MKNLRRFQIGIINLKNGLHHYEFEIDETFLSHFPNDILQKANVKVALQLDKSERILQTDFTLEGTIELRCDRSLELFDKPIQTKHRLIFKYGEAEDQIDEQVSVITADTQHLDLAQPIFEFVLLSVPMKRLHPKYEDQEDDTSPWVYSSETEEADEEQPEADPRWAALQKLKNNNSEK
ncbi:MAG: DUF177 domain-containing protein [Bernardetiaceae bacterium]|nr:DUF177 domain-containing protein [Bernardetiaceae bacterium]